MLLGSGSHRSSGQWRLSVLWAGLGGHRSGSRSDYFYFCYYYFCDCFCFGRSRHFGYLGHHWHHGGHSLLRSCGLGGAVVVQDELAYLRVHRFTPAAAAENAVVASTLHFNVAAIFVHNAAAQLVRSAGLPRAGDNVQLAFNGE